MLNIIRLIKNKEKYNCLDEKFKAIGITVSGFEYLKPSVWQDIYDALIELAKKYQEIKIGYIYKLSALRKREYLLESNGADSIAFTSFIPIENQYGRYYTTNLQIVLNANYVRNIEKELKTIFNPKNKVKFLIAHEFGHVLDIYYSSEFVNLNTEENSLIIFKFLSNMKSSKTIINNVLKNKYNKIEYDKQIVESGTGLTINSDDEMYSEPFAECIALDFCNINTEFSEYIVNEFKCVKVC